MSQPDNDERATHREPSLAREVGSHVVSKLEDWLRWTLWGAAIGAAAFGAVGLWYFGTTGLALGALVGAVAGGLAGLVFYYQVS
jgi:uncharacterized protein YcfJ